jgi:hypothetical protein
MNFITYGYLRGLVLGVTVTGVSFCSFVLVLMKHSKDNV